MTAIAVVTIIKNRQEALANTLAGLANQTMLPAEVIVVHMNEDCYGSKEMPFPVKSVKLSAPVATPLAAARNFGLQNAAYEQVIFLDVDCIPSPTFIEDYAAAWTADALLSGLIRYLPEGATKQPTLLTDLDGLSVPDPIRGTLKSVPYELFWSLNFACSKAVFAQIGGFDESFEGYGAEDTDFAFTARDVGIAIKSTAATAYHQYHASYAPPLNHLADIVHNARKFHAKWHCWPMEGWLSKFKALGFIQWNAASIELLKMPSPEELRQYLKA